MTHAYKKAQESRKKVRADKLNQYGPPLPGERKPQASSRKPSPKQGGAS